MKLGNPSSNTSELIRLNIPRKAIGWAIASTIIISVHDALTKWLTADYGIFQILFIRSVIIMLSSFLKLSAEGNLRHLKTKRMLGHGIRILLYLVGFSAFYYSLSLLPLADAVAFWLSTPLIVAVLSGPLLAERTGLGQKIAIAVGFLGVLIMLRPGAEGTNRIGILLAASSAVFYALWYIQTRYLTSTETADTLAFYGVTGFTLASGFFVFFEWITPSFPDAVLLLVIGVLGFGWHYTVAQAYRFAPAHVVSPFDYTIIVWAMILGFFIWGDIPEISTVTGSIFVIASGIYIYHGQSRKIQDE